VASTQLYPKLLLDSVHQLRSGQLFVLTLAFVKPLPQRGMSLNGVAISPVEQRFPGAASRLVLGLPLDQTLGVNGQV